MAIESSAMHSYEIFNSCKLLMKQRFLCLWNVIEKLQIPCSLKLSELRTFPSSSKPKPLQTLHKSIVSKLLKKNAFVKFQILKFYKISDSKTTELPLWTNFVNWWTFKFLQTFQISNSWKPFIFETLVKFQNSTALMVLQRLLSVWLT